MTTTSQAYDVFRARTEAAGFGWLLYWPREDASLPDTPVPLVYFELKALQTRIVAIGGGAGANTHRTDAVGIFYLGVPKGQGLKSGTDKAETLAQLFRSYRDQYISCFAAHVDPEGLPPGQQSPVDNYDWVTVEVDVFWDLTG